MPTTLSLLIREHCDNYRNDTDAANFIDVVLPWILFYPDHTSRIAKMYCRLLFS